MIFYVISKGCYSIKKSKKENNLNKDMEVCSKLQHIVFVSSPSIRFSGQDLVSELKLYQ